MVLKVSSDAEARRLLIKLGLDPTGYLGPMKKVEDATDKAKDKVEDFGDKAKESGEKTAKSAKESGSAISQLTEKIKKWAIAMGAFELLRRGVEFFRQAAVAGLEFTQSMFTLEVAIRGLQRIGLDTTIAGWQQALADLKTEFPIFSKKDFVDAASLAALMTREFGFTEEQIANVVRQSVILAQITGKDLAEAVRGITYAIGSGYFESLQRAGINISRQIIAEEAMRRGYEGSYTALSQNIRAMITYEIVQNNLNAISEDATRIMETTTGQVQRLNASYEDLIMTLGLMITKSDDAKDAVGSLAAILEYATEITDLWASFGEVTGISGPFAVTGIPGLLRSLGDIREALEENIKFAKFFKQTMIDIGVLPPPEPILGDITVGLAGEEITQDQWNEYREIIEAAEEKFAEIVEWGEEKRLDIREKYWKDVEDNAEKHYRKMEDIQQDYEQRVADIGLKESRAVADEQIDYAQRIADAARQAAFRREEAERRYREREIQAEKRFQEKMRQLRENFMLNLEDAVRERDALQIIRLTRQYNLRKTQMERENALSGQDREDAHQAQLRQIEEQRIERQRQLAIEHQRRLEDIAVQAERERAKATVDFARRQQDEKARWDRQKEERNERLAEEFEDLDKEIADRNQKVLDGLRDQHDLSIPILTKIGELYTAFYGPGGPIDNAVEYAINRILQLNELQRRISAMMGRGVTAEDVRTPRGYAEGGTVIASKPTTVTFGEAGLEAATFTPLNRSGVNTDQVTGNLPAGLGGKGGGRYSVGISLSPGLEGKIINQTMDEMSDIIFKIERARL